MRTPEPSSAGLALADIVQALRLARAEADAAQRAHGAPCGGVAGPCELPSREAFTRIIALLCGVLYPARLGAPGVRPSSAQAEDFFVGHLLDNALRALLGQLRLECRFAGAADPQAQAQAAVDAVGAALPTLRRLLDSDVQAAYDGDPAARSVDEVLLCYPGVRALIHHRIAHVLYCLGLRLSARLVAEIAHSETGIDIHPGASIGPGFFIDHGTGVVIGETAVIGCNVRLYQHVTLGARRFELDDEGRLQKGGARHPILEDDVVIYAGATLLGRVTIGRGSSIGGNVWLTRSVPPGSLVTQAQNQQGQRDDFFASGAGI